MYFVLKFLDMYVQPMLNMDITVNYLMLFVQVECPHCYITCMLLRSTAGHDWFSKGRLPHPQNRIISQVPPLQVLDPNFQLGCMEVHCQEKVGNLITCWREIIPQCVLEVCFFRRRRITNGRISRALTCHHSGWAHACGGDHALHTVCKMYSNSAISRTLYDWCIGRMAMMFNKFN